MDEVDRSAYLGRNRISPTKENQKLKFHITQEKSIMTVQEEWSEHYLQNLSTKYET